MVWLEKVVLEFFIPLATLTVLNILLLKMVSIIFTKFQNFKANDPNNEKRKIRRRHKINYEMLFATLIIKVGSYQLFLKLK